MPSPAANTTQLRLMARGGGVEPPLSGPKPDVLPLDDPRSGSRTEATAHAGTGWEVSRRGRYSRQRMGSLIKKRRKRMRKKKHKKMLKRTRFQRRAKK